MLSNEPREKVELNETSSDKNSSIDNAAKVNNDQTSHDIKANGEILDETISAKGPTNLDRENLTNVDLKTKINFKLFLLRLRSGVDYHRRQKTTRINRN